MDSYDASPYAVRIDHEYVVCERRTRLPVAGLRPFPTMRAAFDAIERLMGEPCPGVAGIAPAWTRPSTARADRGAARPAGA